MIGFQNFGKCFLELIKPIQRTFKNSTPKPPHQPKAHPMQTMKPMKRMTAVAACGLALGMMTASAQQIVTTTDTFGSGPNTFTIDFVTVGNPGNANDAGAGGGSYSSPYGGVDYVYRMSTYAVSQNDITKATAAGLTNVTAGAHSGDQPAANISWYEAAAFVNWLNTSNGYQAAYNLTFNFGWSMTLWSSADAWQLGGENLYRHKNAYYFLPSEDEWYKAAFHQNDGVTANYWDYAMGSNTAPTAVASGTTAGTAVYNQAFATGPADVNLAGGLSPYGTMGQNGNVWEWTESALDGSNNVSAEFRALRGGFWNSSESSLRSSARSTSDPSGELNGTGFRVASVPEPSSALLVLLGGVAWLLKKRRRG